MNVEVWNIRHIYGTLWYMTCFDIWLVWHMAHYDIWHVCDTWPVWYITHYDIWHVLIYD